MAERLLVLGHSGGNLNTPRQALSGGNAGVSQTSSACVPLEVILLDPPLQYKAVVETI